jgi:hypothetical protein
MRLIKSFLPFPFVWLVRKLRKIEENFEFYVICCLGLSERWVTLIA